MHVLVAVLCHNVCRPLAPPLLLTFSLVAKQSKMVFHIYMLQLQHNCTEVFRLVV